jgi:hypothetical protein
MPLSVARWTGQISGTITGEACEDGQDMKLRRQELWGIDLGQWSKIQGQDLTKWLCT